MDPEETQGIQELTLIDEGANWNKHACLALVTSHRLPSEQSCRVAKSLYLCGPYAQQIKPCRYDLLAHLQQGVP